MRILILSFVLACGRTDLGGYCMSSTLAEPLGLVLGAEVADDNVYWMTGGGSAGPTTDLLRTSKSGHTSLTLAKNVAGGFAVDASRAYYTKPESNERASLWSVALDGTGASMLVRDIDRSALVSAVDERILLATSHGIVAISKSNGSSQTISPRHAVSPVRSDDAYLYFAEWRQQSYAIVRTNIDGTNAETLSESTRYSCIQQLVVGTSRVAWVDYVCPGGRVSMTTFTAPKLGGATVMVPEMGGPIAIDGDALFGTNAGGCWSCMPHLVDVIAEDGTVMFHSSAGETIQLIAVDDHAVYVGTNTFFSGTMQKPVGALIKLCR